MAESHASLDPAATAQPAPIRACLFGPAEISIGTRQIQDHAWPRKTARALLLVLLATPGHACSRDWAIEQFWPEASPASATNALYGALHALRRVLEPDLASARRSSYIETTASTIRIRPTPGCVVDVDAFERLLSAPAPNDRRAHLQQVVGAYHGDLLAHEPDAEWAIARRESLRRAWERAVLELAELDRLAGEPLAAEECLLRLVQNDPLNEPAHVALIRGYLAAGRVDRAIGQYRACSAALLEMLGVAPSAELDELIRSIPNANDEETRPSRPKSQGFRAPLPPYPTIGREAEIHELTAILTSQQSRLVTLTGPGGIGKTHLAMTAGSRLTGHFADGVLLVPLAGLRDRAGIVSTLAHQLGIREDRQPETLEERLIEALQHRHLLLMLDNFEHLLDAAPLLAELLAATSGVSMLITSRETLRLRGERVVSVPALASLAASQPPTAANAAASPAEAFFVARVIDVAPGFTLTRENAPQVAEICRRLAGIPLALELAAAWARRFSLPEIIEQLLQPLSFLVDGPRDLPVRHQTMRNAIAWSCDLLEPRERWALDILSVFSDGCTTEAATAVIASTMGLSQDEAGRMLGHLADCHLLNNRSAQQPRAMRVTMLETIQEFAAEGLAARDSGEVARACQAEWFLTQAESASRREELSAGKVTSQNVDEELGNLRVAFAWLIERHPADALRLAIASWRMFERFGVYQEGIDWLERALAHDHASATALIAQASFGAGWLLYLAGELERAQAHFARVESLNTESDFDELVGRIETVLGSIAYYHGDYAGALELIERGGARCTAAGDFHGSAEALLEKPSCLFHLRRRNEALQLIPTALHDIKATGDRRRYARALTNFGMLLSWAGDSTTAGKLLARSLQLGIDLNDIDIASRARMRLGEIQGYAGRDPLARALCSEALAGFRQTGRIIGVAGSLFYRGIFSLDLPGTEALDDLTESLHLWQRMGSVHTLDCLQAIATIAIERYQDPAGLNILAAIACYREANQQPLRLKRFQQSFDHAVAQAKAQLPPPEFDARWQDGSRMAIEDAVGEALVFVANVRTDARTR